MFHGVHFHPCCVPSGGHCAAVVQLSSVRASPQATLPTGPCPHGPSKRPVSYPGCVFQGCVTIVQAGIKASSGRAEGSRSQNGARPARPSRGWVIDIPEPPEVTSVRGQGQWQVRDRESEERSWGGRMSLGQLPLTDQLHVFPSCIPSL